jgi:pyruvate ferredoxin oxidoreductase beta subunit
MPRLKEMARRERGCPPLQGGHALCQGCGIPVVVRTVLDSIETPVVVVNATGCLEVATTRYPTTAWAVPWLHVAFENTAAVASGVESAFRVLQRRGRIPADERITFVAFAGDGGTYDIGLQALSGMLERGHHVLFVCYDNGAYMNTGIQRSSATPFGANTTTSPAGSASPGKAQQRKDITAIAVAHGIPYAAQGSASHWHDLAIKAERAAKADGPAFLNVLSDCPLGWGHEARDGIRILDLAVESRFWPLYEVADGEYTLNHVPERRVPVVEFLRGQKRFAHLFKPENEASLAEVQVQVDREWERLVARCGVMPPHVGHNGRRPFASVSF